ncbi:sulfatase-like hydrolase/transferase [Maribellus comscasis]|nr:sulfatase-like hydrolase/transferase [Maribellus comscasis]
MSKPNSEKVDKRPNIVFIMADDLGYGELGCYGCSDIHTPNLDNLATEGFRFTDFYANAPVCSPTRAALLTGGYQQRLGMDDALYYQEMGRGLKVDGETIANALKSVGYTTGVFGKWHVGYDFERRPLQQGFDNFFGILGGNHHYFEHMDRIGVYDLWSGNDTIIRKGYTTNLITEEAIEFIENNKEHPFFLYLSHLAPHFPYLGPNDKEKDVRPNHKSWQQEKDPQTYISMVEYMDSEIGRVLEKIKNLGLSNRTLVVFTSDNGGAHYAPYNRNAPFTGYKASLWEGGIRVPCIASWHGVLPAGEVTAQVGITMDWSSTFLRLANFDAKYEKEDGINLMPILLGDKPEQERTLFWRIKSGPVRKTSPEYWAVRDNSWKLLIEKAENNNRFLFDLKADPGESNNLIEEHPEIADRLVKQLRIWEESVDCDTIVYHN